MAIRASLVAQTVKSPPALQETRGRLLVQEDSLEKGMATHSSIPTCGIPCTEEPGGMPAPSSCRIQNGTVSEPSTASCQMLCAVLGI